MEVNPLGCVLLYDIQAGRYFFCLMSGVGCARDCSATRLGSGQGGFRFWPLRVARGLHPSCKLREQAVCVSLWRVCREKTLVHPNPSPKPILHDQELTQIDVFAQPLEFLVRTFLHPTPSAKPILHDQ